MDTLNLYEKMENIGEKLYANDDRAWVELQEALPELSEFILMAAQLSVEIKKEILSTFSKLLDAIENVDQLLTADTIYYEICELLSSYESICNNKKLKIHKKTNLCKNNINTLKVHKKNRECLKNKKGDYYQKLIEYCDEFDLNDEEIAVDEYGNIAVLKNDRWWRINSFYNSEYVAQLALQEIKKQNYISCLYIFGMGNLDTVRVLVENVASDTMVFIYEPNPKILGINSYYNDWSDILNKENVLLFVEGLNEEELAKCTYIRMENIAYQYYYVYIQPEYGKVYPDEISKKMQICQTMLRDAIFADNTIDKYAEKFNYNRIMNIPWIYKSTLVSDMKKYFMENIPVENMTAVLVAAGPSLDENMQYLKQIKGNAFILAVDSAIRMCKSYGVKPDAFVTVDPQKQQILFENEIAQNTPLFWGLSSVYNQVRQLRGKKIFCNMDSYLPEQLNAKLEYISAGGSVANTALSILMYLGFHKIIAIGLDLAFLKDKKHASVVYDDGGINEKERRLYTEVKGRNGETLLTYSNFVAYKEDIERRIKAEAGEDIVFVNASKGAYIEGAIHMSFAEAIEKYICKENINYEKLIEDCPKSFSMQDSINVKEYILNYIQDCERIYNNYKECYELYDSLKNMNNIRDIHKVMDRIDTLYMNVEHSFAGQLIVDYSSAEADKILDSMYKECVNSEKYSHDNLNSIAEKGMQISKIFMKNANKTKEMFKESVQTI